MNASSFPLFDGIDYTYRPRNYFFPMSAARYLLATVKGTERRKEIEHLIESGNESEIQDWMAHSALDESTRKLIGSFHPTFMGGEYLPDLKRSEVEIARIELASTTSDVVSIRALQSSSRIYYRLVDEYMDDQDFAGFKVTPRWSRQPLSLMQLIELIETAQDREYGEQTFGLRFLDESYREYDFELDTCRTFLRVTSAFYPQLGTCYDLAIEQWYQGCLSELEVEDSDE